MKLGLVGSNDVVRAWNAFRAGSNSGDVDELFSRTARLLSAMRIDCGHYGTTLRPIEMLALVIKGEDIKQLEERIDGFESDRQAA